MKPVLDYFEELIWKHEFDIKRDAMIEDIAWEIKQEYPGDYEPRITEIERGYRLDLIFKDSEEATLFNLRYQMK